MEFSQKIPSVLDIEWDHNVKNTFLDEDILNTLETTLLTLPLALFYSPLCYCKVQLYPNNISPQLAFKILIN